MPGNRPDHEAGFDLNRWVWRRKGRSWKRPWHIITPSRWLADCTRQSILMHDWPVSVVHNALDTDAWQPIERTLARQLMDLPTDCRLLAFCSSHGGKAPHKGMDLLLAALGHLRGEMSGLELVIFGQSRPCQEPSIGYPLHYTGYLHDDISLRLLYSAADVLVIPSRQDNLPNAGVEALACGTPVVAFNTCGLPDIVTHKKTGWLAKPFDTEDLARGISWVLSDDDRHQELRRRAREDAVTRFSYPIIAKQYRAVYEQAIASQSRVMP
jgi:glycosyltransferase involved in cell wall biosynthesis